MKYSELLDPNAANIKDSVLDKMRREDPVYWCEHEAIRAWFVTRYDDVLSLLKNDSQLEFGSIRGEILKQSKAEQEELSSLVEAMDNLMSAVPRDRHKIVQKLLLEYLSMRVLKTAEADILNIIRQTITDFGDSKEVNIVKQFAYPIPAHVVASLLGIPKHDWERFIEWTSALEPLFWPYDYEKYLKAKDCMSGMLEYFKELIPKAMEYDKNSISAKFGEAVQRGELSADEALVNCAVLIFAGHETTANIINDSVSMLFEHPGLLETLRSDLSLIPNAVMEVIRYRPAIGWLRRTATEDFEFRGQKIKKDDVIFLGTYAANRDPEVYPNPHVFDIHRKFDKPSLTFGAGTHYCLGAALAQMETKLALTELITCFPDMQLDISRIKRKPAIILSDAIMELPLVLHGV